MIKCCNTYRKTIYYYSSSVLNNLERKTDMYNSCTSNPVFNPLLSAHTSVSTIHHLRTGGHWFKPPAQPIFFRRIHDSHCNEIHSSFTTVHFLDSGNVGKQSVNKGVGSSALFHSNHLNTRIRHC